MLDKSTKWICYTCILIRAVPYIIFLHLDLIDEKSNLLSVFPIFHVAGSWADSLTVDDYQGYCMGFFLVFLIIYKIYIAAAIRFDSM